MFWGPVIISPENHEMKVPLVGKYKENMQWLEMTVFNHHTIVLTDVYIAIAYLWYPDIFRGYLSIIVHRLCHRSNQNVRSKEILCTKKIISFQSQKVCMFLQGLQQIYLMIKGVCFRAFWKLIVHWSKQTQTYKINKWAGLCNSLYTVVLKSKLFLVAVVCYFKFISILFHCALLTKLQEIYPHHRHILHCCRCRELGRHAATWPCAWSHSSPNAKSEVYIAQPNANAKCKSCMLTGG